MFWQLLYQIGIGITEEPANISATEWNASNIDGEEHWYGSFEMSPLSFVVASPDRTIALAPSEESAGEYEWSILAITTAKVAFHRRSMQHHAITEKNQHSV